MHREYSEEKRASQYIIGAAETKSLSFDDLQ
jgi:hypothetical protein